MYPSPDKDTNIQDFIAVDQTPKGKNPEESKVIDRKIIATEDVVVIRTTDPMVVLREKGKVVASMNLLLRAAAYDTKRHRNVLTLQQTKEIDIKMRTQRMVRITKKDGEVEPSRMKPESSAGIYVAS